MMDLVLVKKDMLRFVQDVRGMRRMVRDLSDNHIVLCKVRLVGVWIKSREVVNRARRSRSEKLREHQYREGYSTSLDGKKVKRYLENNVKHMWELVKWAIWFKVQEKCMTQL